MTDTQFLLNPNWIGGVNLSEIFRTNVVTKPIGTEQRSAIYLHPRLEQEISININTYEQKSWLQYFLYKYLKSTFDVPIFPDFTYLSSQAASSQNVINVAEAQYRRIEVGRKLIIIDPSDFETFEIGTIQSIDSNEITLEDDLANTWDSGSYVYPLFSATLSTQQNLNLSTSLYQDGVLRFYELLESGNQITHDFSISVDQYLSEDVFTIEPNWVSNLDFSFSNSWYKQEYYGVGNTGSKQQETSFIFGMKFTVYSKQDIWELRNFFASKYGRYGRFWIPSWQQDIKLSSSISDTDTVLSIENINYNTRWFVNSCTGRHLFFILPDGTFAYRYVTAATSNTITINANLGMNITEDQAKAMLVSFLLFVRSNQDEFLSNYINVNTIETNIQYVSIPSEAPSI